ncbi:MAG: family 20 glycosylhydrolase, partial [Bacteroidota bacterium]
MNQTVTIYFSSTSHFNKHFFRLALSLITLISLTTCQKTQPISAMVKDIEVHWELLENGFEGKSAYQAQFTLANKGDVTLPAKGWALYFNRLPREVTQANGDVLQIKRINGDFFSIQPTESFTGLAPGDTLKLTYTSPYWAIKESDAPCGLYFVFEEDDAIEVVENYHIIPFVRPEQYKRNQNDQMPFPSGEFIYAENQKISEIETTAMPPFLPTPAKYKYKKDTFVVESNTTVYYADESLKDEATFLVNKLTKILGIELSLFAGKPEDANAISLQTKKQKVKDVTAAAYKLSVEKNKGIYIEASDQAGVFYGVQSLLNMIPTVVLEKKTANAIPLKEILIQDAPAFSYRGLHVDVSRNFKDKEAILKLLDLMAFYKLNKFHFHLTDDEGWRLEIKALPELTTYGSRRAHTLDESEHLFPAYGSGPFEDSQGSGYYSREDFIEILKYAAQRHIEVIPEIDLPGHARAAIKAMEYRYQNLMEQGDEKAASAFLLSDPEDASQYSSVQGYTDNVICVCRESSYDFLEVVVEELVTMYEDAGIKLQTLHTGGDEVPSGAWEASPICQNFMQSQEKYQSAKTLTAYFLSRFKKILDKFSIATAGWEEITLNIDTHGESLNETTPNAHKINTDFVGENVIPYVWNTVYGWGGEDLAYRLANTGFKIVMCNAPNLYFDFAYNTDPREPGY